MINLKWNRDGAEIVKGMFSKKTISNCLKEIRDVELKKNKISQDTIFEKNNNQEYVRYIPNAHHNLKQFSTLINSEVLSKSAKFLNSKTFFWDTDFHSRLGDDAKETPPHQDSFLKCMQDGHEHMLTCYVALSKITKKCNLMKIIRGSHKNKTMKHKRSSILGFSSVIENDADLLSKKLLDKEVDILLSPGDALFFHSKIIHYTKRRFKLNKIKKRRMALSIRIFGENIKFSKSRKKIYIENVKYNRKFAIKRGLTKLSPTKTDPAYK